MTKALLRTFSFLLLAFGMTQAYSQHNCNPPQYQEALNGNNVRALILTGGDLFWNGEDAQFQVPYQPGGPSTIFAQGLWLAGIDPGGNLKLAAQTYGRNNERADYWPGPLNEEGTTNADACTNWDRVFSVLRYQIEAHLADFNDDGVVDNPLPEILARQGGVIPIFQRYMASSYPTRHRGLPHSPMRMATASTIRSRVIIL